MFLEGSGYQPDYILDKDIVLVTFNYRLGPIGTMWRIIINIFLLILLESIYMSIRGHCIGSRTLVMRRDAMHLIRPSVTINSENHFKRIVKATNTSPSDCSWQNNWISKTNRSSVFSVMNFMRADLIKFSVKSLEFNYWKNVYLYFLCDFRINCTLVYPSLWFKHIICLKIRLLISRTDFYGQ